VTLFEPTHTPLTHVSVRVHALPSLHVLPLVGVGVEHSPVAGLQVPAVWHESPALQTTGFEPTHAPLLHKSVCVHALPSLHEVVLGATGLEHTPVPGSQTPGTWHTSDAVHVTSFDPTHVPLLHVSVFVQALPSLQAVVLAGNEQAVVCPVHAPWQTPVPGHSPREPCGWPELTVVQVP
jgi:hypothetical protein